MATATGTADNYLDVLTKLRDFLVSTGSWSVIGGKATGAITADTDYVSLKGTGLTGDDEILVSMQPYSAPANNAYAIRARGHTAYTSPGTSQPGADSPWCYVLMLNAPVTYWFVANGRRFIMVVKSGSRYDAMYAGFVLPEHLPSDWSYPLFVGGSSSNGDIPQANDGFGHANFWNPIADNYNNAGPCSAWLFSPIQSWVPIRNGIPSSSDINVATTGRMSVPWARIYPQNHRRQLDNQPWFTRGQLVGIDTYSDGNKDSSVPEGGTFYGSYDGVYYTPAFGATAEQEAVVGGVTLKMFPNVGRTSDGHFAAIAME